MRNRLIQWRIVKTLAWRYLWRNYRRTIIMLLAIAVASWAMIFMIALMRGMVDDMAQSSVRTFLGHVQIHHPDYRDDPSIVNRLSPPQGPLLDYLNQEPLRWTARIRVPAVVSSERESLGVILMGVIPPQERALSQVAGQVGTGRFLNTADEPGIVIGRKLARRLDTQLGKRIVIMTQDPDNNIADRGFPVVGIYDADVSSLEERFVFVGLTTAQRLLGVGNQVSEIEIQGEDYRQVDDFYQTIDTLVTNNEVKPWYELDTYTATMLKVMDGFVLVWILVIFLAMSFGLVNTLVMAVFERVREIGLMLALGMRPATVLQQILMETLLLLCLGLLLGNLLVAASIYALRDGIDLSALSQGMDFAGMSSTMQLAVYWQDVVMANGLVIVLGLAASVLPALRASRYDPVRALNKSAN